jgi:hypothetical protein
MEINFDTIIVAYCHGYVHWLNGSFIHCNCYMMLVVFLVWVECLLVRLMYRWWTIHQILLLLLNKLNKRTLFSWSNLHLSFF